MKHFIFTLIQSFALWLLEKTGSRQFHVPQYMDAYWDEISALVRAEEPMDYPGYFKYRRVFTIMHTKYPKLDQRALSKAVQVCSDEVLEADRVQT